ncbi:MAG: CoA-binding protein [Pseudomonadota bacterium]
MADDTTDADLREILLGTRVIALVGASPNPARASHGVMGFLLGRGYRVIPVNPVAAGQDIWGQRVVATLAEAGEADMVDVFRQSEAVPGIVEEALAALPGLRTVWMQLGVVHPGAAARARAAGVRVVQDRCPKIEVPRLGI